MRCAYCNKINSHDYRCPNYIPSKTLHSCSVCNERIYNGDEYVMNDDYEYAHWECVNYAKDLAKFLGCEIKVMENENIE